MKSTKLAIEAKINELLGWSDFSLGNVRDSNHYNTIRSCKIGLITLDQAVKEIALDQRIINNPWQGLGYSDAEKAAEESVDDWMLDQGL